jgi:hypothetical protein
MRLRLEYYDHNEHFARVLPVDGTVARRVQSTAGDEWVLFQLDAPASYENVSYEYFLLRSRWRNVEIGGKEPTSVFVLLVTDQKEARNGFDVHSFTHAAWGMARTL